jgi:Putative FMN-binding domain
MRGRRLSREPTATHDGTTLAEIKDTPVEQVWGRPRVVEDSEWFGGQIRALTDQQERLRAEPWAVGDAPEPFVVARLEGIVSVQLPIARIESKWKVSQNGPPADRAGVAEGLDRDGDDVPWAMARLVPERARPVPSPMVGDAANPPERSGVGRRQELSQPPGSRRSATTG